MSYVILGRAVKNEHIALATLLTTGFAAFAATRGGSSKAPVVPEKGKTVIETLKDAVPINAGSSEEEQFIKQYIKDAEKADGGH